ncbi:hypothetical protein KR084_001821 [Drosophila pseudotakahashii]|nr:hypothetical protein KR084_001821 [Drosophila pseudotakahashii]
MPAGIVKTPISGRTKEAPVAKSAERTASGGKKFVQTRLPFKLLTPGGGGASSSAAAASSSSSTAAGAGTPITVILDEDEPAPRKRKLSYGEETPLEELRRSNSKENLDLASSIASKKVKTTDSLAEDVIELDDDDNDASAGDEEMAVEEVREAKPKPRKPEAKKASPAPPIQIKLPLVNKRSKRRKSLKKSEEALDTSSKEAAKAGSESSDDIEALAEELNPQKKQKVQKPLEKSPEKSSATKKPEEKEKEVTQQGEKESRKQEKPKKTTKESTKEEPKATEPNKKTDQSTIDLFIAKKVETSKKEAAEKGKKKDQSIAEDSEPKEAPQKEAIKPKKAESKAAEKSKKEETKSQPQKEKEDDEPAKNQKEATSKKNPLNVQKKEKAKAVEKEKISKPAEKEEPKSDKESPEAAEISVILSSSEDNSSSSEHEMDVDTDTVPKDGLLQRKSLPADPSDVQKALTPKQQRLLEQRKKAREEKEQKLAEERRNKQQEKEQREQQKKLERDEKEQQRKLEKDQKEQQKKMEREEKERKRQAEVDTKNEEKRKRNEAKEEVQRKKDEERRKKEQEREEAEQKKKRAAESFTKFFVPKQPKSGGGGGSHNTSYLEHEQSSCDSSKASSQTLAFRPFQVKDDMLLAPIVRTSLADKQRSQLDGLFRRRDEQDDDDEEEEDIVRRKPPNRAHLYLSELSSGRREPLKMHRDSRLQRRTKDEEEDDEVQVIDDLSNAGLPIEEEQPKQLARMRAKYLQFADNRRPAYYGTWRKKSTSISARRPLAQDKVHFDYELDSDCEWEEEEPGESLSASEDEKERESEEESEEEYNEWYVPHGHLSDEELQNDGEMDDGHTREAQKAKLQVLQQEFAQEMKKQTKKIKPRLLGPVWLDENGNKSQLFPTIFAHTIDMYACWQLEEPLSLEPPAEPEREDQLPEQPVPLQLDDRLMQQLVRLTHGNRNSKMFLINEYLEYLKSQAAAAESTQTMVLPSKAVLREKFDELASWKTVELGTTELAAAATGASSAKKSKKPKKRLCWVVASEMLDKFQLPELPLQNQWDYTLTPKISEGADAQQHEQSPPADAEATAAAAASPSSSATPTTPVSGQEPAAAKGAKKRATLIMSVPRDQPIHAATKNKLISQFLRRQSDAANTPGKDKEKKPEKPPPAVSDDVVMLSD